MAINLTSLTREWIQFLKNNQITSTQSNPKTGKLNYKRKPNVQELIRFFEISTDFDEESVRKAIKTVVSSKSGAGPGAGDTTKTPALPGKSPEGNLSTWQHTEVTPGNEKQPLGRAIEPPAKPKKYSNDDAEDAEFRDAGNEQPSPGQPPALSHKRKPRFKYRDPGNGLREDFYDRQGVELDERDIKEIFRILLTPTEKPEEPVAEPESDEVQAAKEENLRKVKRLIRDTLTGPQRKALWRMLNEE